MALVQRLRLGADDATTPGKGDGQGRAGFRIAPDAALFVVKLPSLRSGTLPVSCIELTALQRRLLEELAAGEEPSDSATVRGATSMGMGVPG